MRAFLVGLIVVGLVSCGSSRSPSPGVSRGASGPIEKACRAANRDAATPVLCNCIQQVADLTLSSSDQSRSTEFFFDPHRAQEVRQSDRSSDEAFWTRYKEFAEASRTYCSGV